MMSKESDLAVRYAKQAIAAAARTLPQLASLAHAADIRASARVRTAGVFRSRRIVVNPTFILGLTPREAAFVMAHELMHLLLRTHERAEGCDLHAFNVAHDYVINDILVAAFGRVPDGSLWFAGASAMSAETLVKRLQCREGDALDGDVLDDALEDELFGGGLHDGGAGGWASSDVKVDRERIDPLTASKTETMLGFHRLGPPSNAAGTRRVPTFERWLKQRAAGLTTRRSWSRPSRRGDSTLRPGRDRRGPSIGVVLDTSSSMLPDMGVALSALRWLATVAGEGIRLVQTDGRMVTSRSIVEWSSRARVACGGDHEIVLMTTPCPSCGVKHAYRIQNADTDLSAALELLNRDPSIDGIVVLTDGYITPITPPSKPTLWVLPARTDDRLLPLDANVVTLGPGR